MKPAEKPLKLEDVFEVVVNVPRSVKTDPLIDQYLTLLANSDEQMVTVINYLGYSPATWGKRVFDRNWSWRQRKDHDTVDADGNKVIGATHHFISKEPPT